MMARLYFLINCNYGPLVWNVTPPILWNGLPQSRHLSLIPPRVKCLWRSALPQLSNGMKRQLKYKAISGAGKISAKHFNMVKEMLWCELRRYHPVVCNSEDSWKDLPPLPLLRFNANSNKQDQKWKLFSFCDKCTKSIGSITNMWTFFGLKNVWLSIEGFCSIFFKFGNAYKCIAMLWIPPGVM